MVYVNALGDACPIPVVKTLNAIRALEAPDTVETLVDNEVAVQNLIRMADKKGCAVHAVQLEEKKFRVTIVTGESALQSADTAEVVTCALPEKQKRSMVAAISSAAMGCGDDVLGKTLMKGFLYALSQQEELPVTVLFYNGGAALTCEGSASLEDIRSMERRGAEILTCGTCLDFYGLRDKLAVGQVSNMYDIVEKMTQADALVKP